MGLCLSLKGSLVYVLREGTLVSSDHPTPPPGGGGGGGVRVQRLTSFLNALHMPGRHLVHFRVLGRLLWGQFLPAFSLGTETSHGLW